MSYKDASLTYKETRIKTAGQSQLIVMLYDEALKQLAKAVELLEINKSDKKNPGNIEQIGKAIMKTEEIITELMISLDFEQGGEIAKNLFSLYTWFNRELIEANITQDIDRIKAVMNMLSDLRNSWSTISQNTALQPGHDASPNVAVGINIAG